MSRFLGRIFCLSFLAALALPASGQTTPPNGYYDAAIGKTGAALKTALHDIIKGHTQILYTASSTDTWDALKVLDEDPSNTSNVLMIYSGFSQPKSEQATGSSGTWNREHLWPQSFGLEELKTDSRAKTDLFNLRPADIGANSSRGNKFYDVSIAPISHYATAPQSSYDTDSWEPRTEEKGLIARSLFYMAVRYDGAAVDEVPDLELSDSPSATPVANTFYFGKLTTLLAWNRLLVVTASERARNHRVYTDYQHNRNPFIDHPEFADMVFSNVTSAQAWKNLRFTTAELSNTAISGDTADSDGDGLRTVVEYAFNRDPRVPDSAPLFNAKVNADGSVQLIFTHNRFASDVTLGYESSTNLLNWNPVTPQILNTTVTSFENEQITARIPGSGSPFFVRVRVTRP